MIFVTREQMQQLDRLAIQEAGIPGEMLMERAGRWVAEHVLRILSWRKPAMPAVLLVAGRGNNGGDAFCAARHLLENGVKVSVRLAGSIADIVGDARKHLERARQSGVPITELPEPSQWQPTCDDFHASIIVDGLLGTGFSGEVRQPQRAAIEFINLVGRLRPVIAIDLPSGLDADLGPTQPHIVRADLTVTMGLPKKAFMLRESLPYLGSLEVADIGIPRALRERITGDGEAELISAEDVAAWLPRRPRESHKGDFGHLLIIGGSQRYAGAAIMAARAAVRSGAGLVTLLVPRSIANAARLAAPEVIVESSPEDDTGALAAELWSQWRDQASDFSALLIGPGMTRGPGIHTLVRNIIRDVRRPLVVDADAISVMAGQPHWFERAQSPVVITPHPGELGRLLSEETSRIQADRMAAALRGAELTEATIALKGAGTIVAAAGRRPWLNLCGNPGMATGGSGDVLAGLLAGLLAQKVPAFEAACAAVFLHGKAGDIAAWKYSPAAMTAMDICRELPEAFKLYACP